MVNSKSSFQYYYLKNLWKDIQKTVNHGIKIMNLFTEPLSTGEVLSDFFPQKKVGEKASPEVHYDLHTKHARYWGKNAPYIYTKNEIMKQLSVFVQEYNKF